MSSEFLQNVEGGTAASSIPGRHAVVIGIQEFEGLKALDSRGSAARQVEWLPRVEGEEVRFASDSPLEGDGFELPVPREKGWSFDGSLSSAPFKSLRVSTKTTRFLHEGPMVRIRLPPAGSPDRT